MLQRIQTERGKLAATHSRLEFAASHSLIQSETLEEARSRSTDVAFAIEIAELTRLQILENAQIAVIAQANLSLSLVALLLNPFN